MTLQLVPPINKLQNGRFYSARNKTAPAYTRLTQFWCQIERLEVQISLIFYAVEPVTVPIIF